MTDPRPDRLDTARQNAGLSLGQLWLRYFGVGGKSAAMELDAVLHGALQTTDHDHDQIVHALNERFTELGQNHPIPYSSDLNPPN